MFDELVVQHGGRLYALCLKLCNGNEADAKDLYQETWLKAYKAIESYDTAKKIEPWISRICVNTYKDLYRRSKLVSFVSGSTNEKHQAMLESIEAEAEDESYRDVRDSIARLPVSLKVCIILYYFHGLSVQETAEVLKIPEGTVKSRLHKARNFLEKELAENA